MMVMMVMMTPRATMGFTTNISPLGLNRRLLEGKTQTRVDITSPVSSLNAENPSRAPTAGEGDNPSASFIQTFALSTVVGPSVSAAIASLQPFDHVSIPSLILLVILQVILSLPVALVLAALAAVCAVTVNSPNFYNRLVNLYNTAVPSSVQEVR
jgi:hypothetical protein